MRRRLRELARRHPGNAEVALLAAEALLNLHPYDWWTRDGTPQPWTPEIEAPARPCAGAAAAPSGRAPLLDPPAGVVARIRSARWPAPSSCATAVPGSGHLLHMPSHIYMRVGRFDDAIRANQRSIEADLRYLAQVDAQGAYRVGYVAHNHHFLWAAASMAGRHELALQAAHAAWPAACGPGAARPRHGDRAAVRRAALLHAGALRPVGRAAARHAAARLGRALPAGDLALRARHGARAHAASSTPRSSDLERLERLAAEPSLAASRIKNLNADRATGAHRRADAARRPGAGARRAALGRRAAARGDPHRGCLRLRRAAPVAGADATRAGRRAARRRPARSRPRRTYREDLRHYPDNGWSLSGVARALAQQGRPEQARLAADRARQAFGQAERLPPGSRF